MSKIHALEGDGLGKFRCVVHFPVPTGNNTAGKTWQEVLLASGRSGTTVLTVGAGAGQMDAAEKATVDSGAVCELVMQVPVESGGGGTASFTKMIDDEIASWKLTQQAQLKFYGKVVA